MSGVTLRKAVAADRPLLERWDEAPHVLASDPNDDWGWETELARDPDWREQLIAVLDGRPIGFVQIIDPAREDSRYWGDCAHDLAAIDIWIGEADCLGQGFGSTMMRLAIERCFADPRVQAIVIDPLASNLRAQRFYARFGFRPLGPRRFGLDDCLVMRLDRSDHASRIGPVAINLHDKLARFQEHWSPRVVAELNDYQFKLAKLKGDFVWHAHAETDEAFLVLEGRLRIELRDGAVELGEGELYVVPRGVEHRPCADEECHVLLIEPRGVVNTGESGGALTAKMDVWI